MEYFENFVQLDHNILALKKLKPYYNIGDIILNEDDIYKYECIVYVPGLFPIGFECEGSAEHFFAKFKNARMFYTHDRGGYLNEWAFTLFFRKKIHDERKKRENGFKPVFYPEIKIEIINKNLHEIQIIIPAQVWNKFQEMIQNFISLAENQEELNRIAFSKNKNESIYHYSYASNRAVKLLLGLLSNIDQKVNCFVDYPDITQPIY